MRFYMFFAILCFIICNFICYSCSPATFFVSIFWQHMFFCILCKVGKEDMQGTGMGQAFTYMVMEGYFHQQVVFSFS